MPLKIRRKKKGKKTCYVVRTPHGTKAKCTTRRRAMAQARLLRAVEHGFVPR